MPDEEKSSDTSQPAQQATTPRRREATEKLQAFHGKEFILKPGVIDAIVAAAIGSSIPLEVGGNEALTADLFMATDPDEDGAFIRALKLDGLEEYILTLAFEPKKGVIMGTLLSLQQLPAWKGQAQASAPWPCSPCPARKSSLFAKLLPLPPRRECRP